MSVEACAALVARGDPDRFAVTEYAPEAAQRVLYPLYAFNLEVARAPWVTAEPMIAEMRLQWWRDALEEIAEGRPVRNHEVSTPLADVLDAEGARCLDKLIEARRWDITRDPFASRDAFWDYLDATSGHLMWTAARLLGCQNEEIVRGFAFGCGMASFIYALPMLQEGRPEFLPQVIGADYRLAKDGLARLNSATNQRKTIGKTAHPALQAGWLARPRLERHISPDGHKKPQFSEIYLRLRLAHVTMRGWWV